ncbi:MAG TPA: ribosome maturation factor RimP [Thermodesulfovibrionia bacterium]|nr:ribosome maturation factor RimP [Thermodesulfovibrionia bacterium]
MKTELVKEKLSEILKPLIEDMGYSLFDIAYFRGKNRAILRIYIEKESGVTIDDCEKVSREVGSLLDLEDIIPSSYMLEVSSPGIDRPIRCHDDFKKALGKKVRIVTIEPIDKQTFFLGRVEATVEDEIELLLTKDKRVRIPYKNISKARLEIEF